MADRYVLSTISAEAARSARADPAVTGSRRGSDRVLCGGPGVGENMLWFVEAITSRQVLDEALPAPRRWWGLTSAHAVGHALCYASRRAIRLGHEARAEQSHPQGCDRVDLVEAGASVGHGPLERSTIT